MALFTADAVHVSIDARALHWCAGAHLRRRTNDSRGHREARFMLHTWDYMSADHHRLKWEIFGYARGQCPVARTEEGGGFWLVTGYDDFKRVLEDWETFSSTTWMPGNSNVPHAVNLEFDRVG